MRHLALAAVLAGLTVAAGPVMAQGSSLASMQVACALGGLLGSERFCALDCDADAVGRFIEAKVDADDMAFSGTLNMMIMGTEPQLKGLSPAAKAAHCTQARRVAEAHGLMAE